jgi:hypothetical protein
MRAELLCLPPGPHRCGERCRGCARFAALAARARAAVARRWAAEVIVRFLASACDPGWPAGVFASQHLPTLVVSAGGRVLAEAVGDLPGHELEFLLERALRST